jgi:hypothetical protein
MLYSGKIEPSSLKLYSIENGAERSIEFTIIADSANSRAALSSSAISWASARGTKQFYLQAGAATDTLELDVRLLKTGCCVYHEWASFTINSAEPARDSSWVYFTCR